ncbi:hypothetical protein FCE95_00005, partial [Luteimonas gilva]
PIQQAIWLDDLPVGLLAGATTNQKLHYLQPDHLGTPRAVIDTTANTAIWRWDLEGEAFGNTIPNQDPDSNGTAFVMNMRFPGQRYDSASGLNYNYFRNYEAGAGRYAESDPLGLMAGPTTYTYVASAPFAYSDRYGLFWGQLAQAACEFVSGVGGYWHRRKENHYSDYSRSRLGSAKRMCDNVYLACKNSDSPSCVPDAIKYCEEERMAVECDLAQERKDLGLVDPFPWWDILGELCNIGMIRTKTPRDPIP